MPTALPFDLTGPEADKLRAVLDGQEDFSSRLRAGTARRNTMLVAKEGAAPTPGRRTCADGRIRTRTLEDRLVSGSCHSSTRDHRSVERRAERRDLHERDDRGDDPRAMSKWRQPRLGPHTFVFRDGTETFERDAL
jgi:hypothetical protein